MNRSFFYCGFLIFSLRLSFSLFSWEITREEGERIGHHIFFNECSGKVEKLVWWNERENFASLGIGHFIKEMPGDVKDPLLAFAETAKRILKRRVQNAPPERHEERWLPGWLKRIDSYIVT